MAPYVHYCFYTIDYSNFIMSNQKMNQFAHNMLNRIIVLEVTSQMNDKEKKT